MLKKQETGRSMLEMLGVLAIIGVISAGGLYGFNAAMNRHKANELINEAQKRAAIIAMQIAAGKTPSDEPDQSLIGEFTDPKDHEFNEGKANDKQFNMRISGVSEDVCEQMRKMVGGAIVDFSPETCAAGNDNTVELVFNNDLSPAHRASVTWDANGDGPTSGDGSICKDSDDTNITLGECQVCIHGEVIDSDAKCADGDICLDGTCITPIGSGSGCTRNSDCKGIIGELDCDTKTCYCNYYDYDNFKMRNGSCNSGPNAGSGVCMEAIYQTTTVAADGIAGKLSTGSYGYMDWYSAKNFCQAVDGSMISANGSLCTLSYVASDDVVRGDCDWETLQKSGSKLANTYWWTKTQFPGRPCAVLTLVTDYSHFVPMDHPFLFTSNRTADNYFYYYALCE